jgi:hypothetical protein
VVSPTLRFVAFRVLLFKLVAVVTEVLVPSKLRAATPIVRRVKEGVRLKLFVPVAVARNETSSPVRGTTAPAQLPVELQFVVSAPVYDLSICAWRLETPAEARASAAMSLKPRRLRGIFFIFFME